MTYKHRQRRKLTRRLRAALIHTHVGPDADARALPRYTDVGVWPKLHGGRDTQVAPHPMRTRRTVLGSLRSHNPRIRRSAKAAAIALGVLPSGLVHPVVAQLDIDTREG